MSDLKFRLKRNWRGRFVLQVHETRNHMEDLGGSGHFDEYQTHHWRNATLAEAVQSGITLS